MAVEQSYRIMGIDPGTNYMGYGVLEVSGKKVKAVILGEIDLHKIADPYAKLSHIFDRVSALVAEYKPREVALESPFFGSNVQSMLKLGRAQGVAMAAALSREVDVFEYAPTRVKQAITGRGGASKESLAAMVKSILGVESPSKRLDATDGMAVALCHYYNISSPLIGFDRGAKSKGLGGGVKSASRKGSSSWEQFVRENPERELKKVTNKK
ncbi:MAG: crossover junction endodeoxyribonuclease RuvC [Rikenellaceae bacterium]